MKVRLIATLIFMSLLLLAACANGNGDNYFKQVDINEANKYFGGNEKGFVLIVTDNDEHFIPTVKKEAKESKVNVVMYNPYQSDGKNDNKGASVFPNGEDIEGDALYYVENNKVQGELDVQRLTDSELTKEVKNFYDLHK